MDKSEYDLKGLMLEQATRFLEDAGEFFPFGTTINDKGKAIPIGVYDDKENLSSIEIINILEENLSDKIKNKESVLIGIGVDVIKNQKDEKGNIIPKNALMIKVSDNGENWKEEYYAYKLDGGVVVWG